ncbi:MAG TPA: hypothetical protein DEP69_05985 [Acidimicrobiaceae bacterium]|nr:hypothetical protein [Acidimicrobiaceae bacterium]
MTDRDAVAPSHDDLVARMTGDMVRAVEPFAGSARLRPDGRPRTEFRRELRRIANLRSALTVAWLLALPVLVVAGVAAAAGAVADAVGSAALRGAVVVAVFAAGALVMGAVQLRMFVLHHEAAHRLLFSRRRLNDFVGITVLGWVAFGAGRHTYRRVHTRHHRDEFGPDEPDFLLYSFYPITRRSLARKLARDAGGVSAWRVLRPLLVGIAKPGRRSTSVRFYCGQLFVFTLFLAAGRPWLFPLLWVLPYVVVYQVLNRLRAVAEHGGMTRSPDRRATTHHVRQHWLTNRWLTPYCVGHHLAHHVDSGVPFRNLPKLTRALTEDGYITVDTTWNGYPQLWRAISSRATAAAAAG